MFTIRVEHGNGVREVYGCASYRVWKDRQASELHVELVGLNGGDANQKVDLKVIGDDKVWIMNASGNTVDSVGGRQRVAG